jgi:hypothetical protein
MAASSIGLSTLVLGVSGVASASDTEDFSFTTDAGQTDSVIGTLTVPAGYCSIDWSVQGGSGGGSTAGDDGGYGTLLEGTTALDGSATTFSLFPGTGGADGDSDAGTFGTGGSNARGGENGTNGSTYLDSNGDSVYSGGGGAASTVVHNGTTFLSAPGGDGGGAPAGSGGGAPAKQDGVEENLDAWWGDGFVSGTVNACPAAPDVKWVEGDDHALSFQIWKADGATVTGTQYSLDGGAWTDAAAVDEGHFQYSGSITGLNTGQTYSVRFRFVTTDGYSQASDATTAVPASPAPVNLHTTVGEGSIHITWAPPADPTGVVGYEVWALPGARPQSDDGKLDCPALDASARECTLIVPAGTAYSVGIVALSPSRSLMAGVVSDVVPAPSAPATVPTGSGPLGTPSGAPGGLAQGSTVTLTGSGYAPNSTVSLYIYSTPTLLGTVTTDGSGSFSKAVTIPASLAPGAHHLVSAGLDPSGNVRYLVSAVTVAQATGTLAWTGFETLPVLGAGLLTVALGAGLIVVARRRRTA